MPRPKKTKVEAVNCLGPSTMDMSTGTTDVEEVSASTVAELAGGSCEDPLKAENNELRKEAAALTKAARKSVQEAAVIVRKAEAALRHERRLDEERERRWWAAERRNEPPPAYSAAGAGVQVAGARPEGASEALRGAAARGGSRGGAGWVSADRKRRATRPSACVSCAGTFVRLSRIISPVYVRVWQSSWVF